MVKVDIYRNTTESRDIVILDMEQYITAGEFGYIVAFLNNNLPAHIRKIYNPKKVKICLEYNGIAIELTGLLDDRKTSKLVIKNLAQEALNILI